MISLFAPDRIVEPQCEWCGESHAREALCQRTKARGMSRRSFLYMGGVGVAAAILVPSSLGKIITPAEAIRERRGSPFYRMFVAANQAPPDQIHTAVKRMEEQLRREGAIGTNSYEGGALLYTL